MSEFEHLPVSSEEAIEQQQEERLRQLLAGLTPSPLNVDDDDDEDWDDDDDDWDDDDEDEDWDDDEEEDWDEDDE